MGAHILRCKLARPSVGDPAAGGARGLLGADDQSPQVRATVSPCQRLDTRWRFRDRRRAPLPAVDGRLANPWPERHNFRSDDNLRISRFEHAVQYRVSSASSCSPPPCHADRSLVALPAEKTRFHHLDIALTHVTLCPKLGCDRPCRHATVGSHSGIQAMGG
jgi:hypothetical protein